MKRIMLLLVLLFFALSKSVGQEKITETQKLATFCKIYGFLKYYHPNVAKEEFNWDKEFFKILPKVMESSDKESLSKVYLNWIDDLGEIEKCKACSSDKKYFDKNFDLSWTQDSIYFNKSLNRKLKQVEENRNLGENHYVSLDEIKINRINEPVYEGSQFPDEGYRLLGLFRYWNIIEYFFPYKYLTDQDWDSVILEMIPKMREVNNESDYHLLLRELVAKLDDTHAWISIQDTSSKFPPVIVSQIEGRPVVSEIVNDSIALLNNLELGDIILKLNDKNFQSLANDSLKYVAGSNPNIKSRYTYNDILAGPEDSLKLTVDRGGQIVDLNIKRYDYKVLNTKKSSSQDAYKLLSESIGYIDMENVKDGKQVIKIFKSIKSENTLIIDLRNYPAMVHLVMSKYLNSEERHFASTYSPLIQYPSRFKYSYNLMTLASKKAFSGKVILLVNEKSLSRSEFLAMTLQTADNVITIGSQTAGSDGTVLVFDYLGGYKTAFTGNGIEYPDGTRTQRSGVKIDVEVQPTINGLRAGRDEILEKAIEIAQD